jgi:predicted transcriptional regulator of viral defense system
VDEKGDNHPLGEMGVDGHNNLLVNIKHQGIGIAEKLLKILKERHGDVGDIRKIISRQIEIENVPVDFFIKYIPEELLFGTKIIWRGNTKIHISDPYKTLLDCIDNLQLGAGLQHIMDCLLVFKQVFNKRSDLDTLLNYAIQIDNGALFKKLGYLAETLEFEHSFIDECHKRLTSGYATLDKHAQHNRLVTRWKLWVPGEKTK